MAENYNSMAFTPEEVEKGQHLKLLKTLFELNADKEDASYNDIHIWTDGYCTIIDWVDYSREFGGGKFEFVPSDGVIMYERTFPDNHTEYCWDEDDYQERLKEFLDKNPGWIKTSYGTWTNEIDNEQLKKWLDEERLQVMAETKSSEVIGPEDYAE